MKYVAMCTTPRGYRYFLCDKYESIKTIIKYNMSPKIFTDHLATGLRITPDISIITLDEYMIIKEMIL